jgi:transcriptional regulator with XRE-family HTH domain
MKLKDQLDILMKNRGLSMSELAREVNVSVKTLHNWAQGQTPRDISQVKQVADFFSVSLDYICFGSSKTPERGSFEYHQDEINAGVFEVILRKVQK